MINARVGLFSAMRSFVEQRLCGVVRWGDVKADKPILADLDARGRRSRTGEFKEIATIRFGDYVLTAHSPADDPPLGWLKLDCSDEMAEGPLDQATFDMMEQLIRTRGMRAFDHGSRERTDSSGWLSGPG